MRESEQRLRLAMSASSAGAWSWNAENNETDWDDRTHAIFDFDAGAPRTFDAWMARLHPTDRTRVLDRLNEVLRTPGDDEWDMEFRVLSPRRGVTWVHGLGSAKRDAEARVVSITGINLDVTARKRADEKLRESEEQLRLFFENAPVAAAMFDRDMNYLAASQRFMSDYRLSGNIIGRSHYDVFPEIPERWKEVHRRCLEGAAEHSEADRFERADGSFHWLKWQIHPWRSAKGDIGGIIILSEDVTEVRESLQTQQLLIEELQHRTRNLISVVEAIARQTMAATDSVEAFMAELATRLAGLSRVQGLLSRSDREPITIGALVGMELEALETETSSRRTRIEGPEVGLRKRSVQTLALAIHELATNARKYGALAANDGRLSVTWQVDQESDQRRVLSLEWLETGIGERLDRAAPRRCGYGRTLIERGLPYALAAQTAFELGDHTFRCVIRLPVDDGSREAAG